MERDEREAFDLISEWADEARKLRREKDALLAAVLSWCDATDGFWQPSDWDATLEADAKLHAASQALYAAVGREYPEQLVMAQQEMDEEWRRVAAPWQPPPAPRRPGGRQWRHYEIHTNRPTTTGHLLLRQGCAGALERTTKGILRPAQLGIFDG